MIPEKLSILPMLYAHKSSAVCKIFLVKIEFFQPANVLMDDAGHIRISDLGLATDCSKKAPTENW